MAAFFDRIVRKRVIFWNEKHKKWPALLLTTESYQNTDAQASRTQCALTCAMIYIRKRNGQNKETIPFLTIYLRQKNRAKEGGEIKENAVISKKCDIGRGR